MGKEVTTNEILEFLQEHGATKTDIENLKKELTQEIDGVKAQMVTKDYLDDKLTDLRGDLVVLMRKEDTKLIELIKTLHNKDILAEDEVKKILEMEPFPKLSL